MSIADMLPRRGRPPIPSGPEQAPPIAAKIAEAERKLDALKAERPEVALDAINGREGADDRFAEIKRQIAVLEQSLADLRSAHDAALAADDRMFRAQRAALYGTQIAKVKRELKARDDAAVRLSKAIGHAVEAYREMVLSSRNAQRANPVGGEWPNGGLVGGGELYRAVAAELFRQGTIIADPERVPGFPHTHPTLMEYPAKMVPLTERIAKASEHVISELTGRAPR